MLHRVLAVLAVLVPLAAWAAPPANDDCATPTVIGSLPFTETIDVSSATGALTDPVLFCNEDGFGPEDRTVWYRFTAGAEDAFLEVSTDGSDYDTMVAVHGGTCGSTTLLECSDNAPTLGEASRGYVAVAAGETVLIEVARVSGAGSSLVLTVQSPPLGHPSKTGPEFTVNTYTYGIQGDYGYRGGITTCAGSDGHTVVAWEDVGQEPSFSSGVYAQRFSATGTAIGGEFQVPEFTTGSQTFPSVACGASGDFVVVWREEPGKIEARRFDGTGAPVTAEITVSSTLDSVAPPSVATDADGDFVVTFEKGDYVLARRYDAAGSPLGAEFQVSGADAYYHDSDGNDAGEVVVAWSTYDAYTYYRVVKSRRMDASGTLAAEVPVANDQEAPSFQAQRTGVSVGAGGDFVVAWVSLDYDLNDATRVRRMDATDAPLGPVLEVSTPDEFSTMHSVDVAMHDDGSFLVAWDGSGSFAGDSILARQVDAAGNLVGDSEFHVETFGVYPQYGPWLAAVPGGDFVVAWSGFHYDPTGCGYGPEYSFCSSEDVRAQRLTPSLTAPTGCAPSPKAGCRVPTVPLKSKLLLVDDPDDDRDQMRWKWVKGEATTQADWGDPTVDTGYALCLYDPSDTLVYASEVEPGGTCGTKPCWKALGNPPGVKGFRMKNKARTPHGVLKLVLKTGEAGKAKIVASGGRALLFDGPGGVPPLPLALPATMQLQSATGECWQATYDGAGVGKNEAGFFKGSGS
jgi:hypothetical protein